MRTIQSHYRRLIGSLATVLLLSGLGTAAALSNRDPVIVGSDGVTPIVVERLENMTYVLRVLAYDPDRDPLTFRLAGGADEALFSISADKGELKFVSAPDWDQPSDQGTDNSYEVAVQVDDGQGGVAAQSYLVKILDSGDNVAPQFPYGDGALGIAVPENTLAVATLSASDPDGDPLTFAIVAGEDLAKLVVDPSSGALAFVAAPDWEQPSDLLRDNLYKILVSVTDGRGGSDYQEIWITVQDVADNGAPVLTPSGDVSLTLIEAQTEPGTLVYRVVARDPDKDVLTYRISGGADGALFAVTADSGALSFLSRRDLWHPEGSEGDGNTYVVEVSVDDGRGGSALQAVHVSIVEDLDPAAPLIDWVAAVHGIDAETEIDGTATYVSGDWPRVIRGISTDLQGGVYLSGSFFGRIWVGETELGSAGFSDTLVARLDPAGEPLWARRFGGRGTDLAPDVATDAQGAALVTGMCSPGSELDGIAITTAGGSDACTAKLSPEGEVLWVRLVGGPETESGNEVCADRADNVLVVGNSDGQVTAGGTPLPYQGGMDTFVLKYDSTGELLWARGISGAADEQGRGIAADPAGNVLVVGEFTGTIALGATSLTAASAERDIFVAKYDPKGTLLWAKRYGAAGEDYARGVGTDAQGYIYVTGVFSDEVAFGQTWLSAPATREQLFLMRLAPNGTVVWAQGITGSGQGHGCEIEVAGYGDSVIACDVMGELQFGGQSVTSLGTRDSVLARFSSAGALLWVKPLGADSDAASFALALDPSGEFVTTAGVYQGNIGTNGYRVTSVPDSSSYIVRLDERLSARSDAIDDLPTYGLAQPGPYAVAQIELTLPADGWPEPVPLRLYVPQGSGPFPIVFFVSGTGATNDTFPYTSTFLASHGYVVLHNSYTRDDSLGDEELWRMRAEGVSFVLDSLDTIVQLEPTLAGKLDTGAIGAMGHSSGAYITQLVGGAVVVWDGIPQSFRDPRIDAFIMYSGQGTDQQGLTASSWDNLFIPMLQMSGTEDYGALDQDPSWRWEPFLFSPPGDKYMGWYYGGTHGSFSGDFVTDPIAEARFEHGETMTLAFWDAYLKASPEAKAFLHSRAPASLAVTPVDFATK